MIYNKSQISYSPIFRASMVPENTPNIATIDPIIIFCGLYLWAGEESVLAPKTLGVEAIEDLSGTGNE